MKLLRLTMQGFKSFADKTTIEFSDGMTVIVGPNGCGKSNISDAVRWVLGEQNVRNLRGQKSEDIIFSGSETRNTKQVAEVTMVLDNEDGKLPLQTAEVTISRRVFRSGESEFYINKRSCRLKDIHELLANSGLGKGTLAIIGQNRVDQVLTAQPEERRLIFEEVAGISLFRMRKNEGLRKLEKTDENMNRVKDMTALLDEQLVHLKEAAEKTKIYRKYEEEQKAINITEHLLKLASVNRMISKYETEIRNLTDENVKYETEISKFTTEKVKFEIKNEESKKELREANEKVAKCLQELEKIRSDYRIKESLLQQVKDKLQKLKEDEEDQNLAENETKEELSAVIEDLKKCISEKEEKEKELLRAEEEKSKISSVLQHEKEEYYKALDVDKKQLAERERLKQEFSHIKQEKIRLVEEKNKKTKDLELIKNQRNETERKLKYITESIEKLQKEISVKKKNSEETGKNLRKIQNEQFIILREFNDIRTTYEKIKDKREYLSSSDRENANFTSATRSVLLNISMFGNGIFGTVGQLLKVPDEYADAAEVILGSKVSNIVVDTSKTAQNIIEWLKRKKLGRTTFYPLASIRRKHRNEIEKEILEIEGVRGFAKSIFKYDKKYSELFEYLLNSTVITENLTIARKLSDKYNHTLRIATLDGQIIHAGGSLTGGSLKKSENTFFGRKKEIEKLLKEEKNFEEKLKNLKQKRLNIDFECSNLSDKVTEVQENCKKLEIDYASLISKKEGLVNSFNVHKSNEEKNNIELQKVSDDLKNIEEKIKVFSEKDISANSLKNTADDGKLKYWTEKEEKVKSSISSIQVDLAKLQEAIHFNQKMKTERENYSILQKNERTELNQEIAETVEKEKNVSKELVQMEELFKTNQKNYEDSKIIQNNLQEKYDIFEQEQKTNDVEWRKIQEESVKLQSKITERKIRLENFKEQELQVVEFFKENNLTVENAEKLRVEGNMQSISGKKIEIERKISELGSVNPNGVEEYEMQLRRREFYETQIHDLVKAKEGLQTVIEDIDKKMEKEFKDAFSLINKEFNRIMNLMFDGGKARLELTDEKSPLDGGVEIYLQLPGKKRQSLTLMSGGERALTVIALLISFMAYKPAPFCFVDEIDASLDDANVARYSSMIADYKKKTQFIVISHRKKTMEYADTLQGVTMGEKGVSSLITVHMKDYIKENNNELF